MESQGGFGKATLKTRPYFLEGAGGCSAKRSFLAEPHLVTSWQGSVRLRADHAREDRICGVAHRAHSRLYCNHAAKVGVVMICRVATHEQTPSPITSDEARSFREWLKEQPGFIDGYHAQDSETRKAVFITVWDSRDSMMALRDFTPPGGSVGITTEWFEIYDVVEHF